MPLIDLPALQDPCRRLWLARCTPLLLACAMVRGHARPAGATVLSFSGRIGAAGPRIDFDMATLAALPQHSFVTRTPWDKVARKFTGPLLRDVLAAVKPQGSLLVASALNAYKVEIPSADAERFDVILARLVDDQPMRVRDRGPLFLIYPFDSDRQLRDEIYYMRSIWQLRAIEVR